MCGSASKGPQAARRRARSLGKDDHATTGFETLSGVANDGSRIVVADVVRRPNRSGKNQVLGARSVHDTVGIFDMGQNRHDVDQAGMVGDQKRGPSCLETLGVTDLDFYNTEPVENSRKPLAGAVDSLPGARVSDGGIRAVEPKAQGDCDPDHAGNGQPEDSKEMCCL